MSVWSYFPSGQWKQLNCFICSSKKEATVFGIFIELRRDTQNGAAALWHKGYGLGPRCSGYHLSRRRGVVAFTTAQIHSNLARGVSEIREDKDLWQWSRMKIRLNAFRRSTIPQNQFIIINDHHHHHHHHQRRVQKWITLLRPALHIFDVDFRSPAEVAKSINHQNPNLRVKQWNA